MNSISNFFSSGSDMCRAMLWFDEAKPLGENGLFWMKVHLSNLFGNNKIPHNERVAFVDANIDKVIACALDPFGDNKVGSDGKIVGADGTYAERDEIWWSKADEPFQALATIIGKKMCFILLTTVLSCIVFYGDVFFLQL